MQVIHDTNAGGRIGAALGAGLNQLAQHKLSQISKQYEIQQERSQFAQGLAPILGQDTANFLSHLGPKEREYALQNIGSLMQLNQQPGQQEQMGGIGVLGQQQQQQEPDQYQQLLQAARQQNGPMAALGGQPQQQQFGQLEPQRQAPGQIQQQVQPEQNNSERAKLIQGIFESPQAKRERQRSELEQKKFAHTEKLNNLKTTQKYVETLKNKEDAAKKADLRLKKMENSINKGNLPNAQLWSLLTKAENAPYVGGLASVFVDPIKSLVKFYHGAADIEEFEKLSNEFVKDAKQYFGSRITEKEVQMFMQTVPNLMQTDAGKKKIIDNMRSLNQLTGIEAKAARSIIKENGGIPPIDIEQQVQDKIASKLDKIAKKFVER
jgi:hypothetical protein